MYKQNDSPSNNIDSWLQIGPFELFFAVCCDQRCYIKGRKERGKYMYLLAQKQ